MVVVVVCIVEVFEIVVFCVVEGVVGCVVEII